MDPRKHSFLGTGWSFPPVFDPINKGVRLVSDEKDIHESIRIIFDTIPGERIMQPEFGCDLKKLVFEKIDSRLTAELNHLIYHALLEFEPRVNFISAELLGQSALNGRLDIQVSYSVITTNTRHNIVFPFYLAEGTNILT